MSAKAAIPEMGQETGAGPRAMSRVLRLFFLLADQPDGLSLAELSAELDVPKSTLRSSLSPLVADGYLFSPNGRYRLGPAAYRLAASMMSDWSPVLNIRPYMRDLARLTGESVAVAQIDRDGGRYVFVDVVESLHGVRYVVKPGRSGILHVGASGRVLLAFQEADFIESYLAKLAKGSSPDVDLSVLRSSLADVRNVGFYVSIGEVANEGTAVAAPVFGPYGDVVSTLTIAGPTSRLQPQLDKLTASLVNASKRASGVS